MPLPESQGNKWRELLRVGLEEQMGPGLAFASLQVPGDTWEEAVRKVGSGALGATGRWDCEVADAARRPRPSLSFASHFGLWLETVSLAAWQS